MSHVTISISVLGLRKKNKKQMKFFCFEAELRGFGDTCLSCLTFFFAFSKFGNLIFQSECWVQARMAKIFSRLGFVHPGLRLAVGPCPPAHINNWPGYYINILSLFFLFLFFSYFNFCACFSKWLLFLFLSFGLRRLKKVSFFNYYY